MNPNPQFQKSDKITIETLYTISHLLSSAKDWKSGLDEAFHYIRPFFIFDNLVIYRENPLDHTLDVMYARATGRGRSAEADISWGEIMANQVVTSKKTILQEPSGESNNRLDLPYILGIPLHNFQSCIGTIIFIRFGGPAFSPSSIQLAEFLTRQITLIVNKVNLELELDALKDSSNSPYLQENYISTISHDLRHPLGFIKGYATTLLRSEVEWDLKSQKEFLRIIDGETDKLQKLIDNLLDSTLLRSGQLRMEFQYVRLDALVKDILTRYRSAFPESKINLQIQTHLHPILGDPLRLSQVLDNLLDNAHQYAPGSEVDVIINHNEQGVNILLRDHGSGISPEHISHIFERFYRVSGKNNEVRGLGLGLYICKEIVEAHHGNITATSNDVEGTTFTIYLPYQP
jgi:K+-sensing histidine kinase KdpD